MTTNEFKEYVKTRQALDTEEIHRFMDKMSNEARRITFRLNTAYHTPDEVRGVLSELFGYQVPSSFRVFPPFYTDFGKNITVGEGVFINACCHFQDHGGVIIGDGCQIGHNVVFATLNHGLPPEERQTTYPAPIVLGRNVWVGSNATILPGVTIGDNAVVGAGGKGKHNLRFRQDNPAKKFRRHPATTERYAPAEVSVRAPTPVHPTGRPSSVPPETSAPIPRRKKHGLIEERGGAFNAPPRSFRPI